ncbi:MAG: YqgE/AlgH family protein [Lautropia sp.]
MPDVPESAASIDLSNHFLLAMPGMADPNFSGAIVFVAEHSEKGALGLVVNKPTSMTLATLLSRIERDGEPPDDARTAPPGPSQPVFFGGPVQGDRGFVLHQPVGNWNATVKIGEDIALTTSRDVLEAVADGRGPARLLVTLGYAGWGPGQLEAEIGQNAWMTMPADPELLFDTPVAERFNHAYRRLGIDPALLSPQAGHA